MQRRGELIRSELPALIGGLTDSASRYEIEGRDATGPKSEIPWVPVFNAELSPSATEGWYAVYLFSALGDRTYLSLNQGTTIWDGNDFRDRPREELRDRAQWARNTLGLGDQTTDSGSEIKLDARRTHLGPQYEAGNVWAIEYKAGSVPPKAQLRVDLREQLARLAVLYDRDSTTGSPFDPPVDVLDAVRAADERAGRPQSRRAGFRQSAADRAAIERRAMIVAKAAFEADGWNIKDVSRSNPFDLKGDREGSELYIEVKGTTTHGSQIILTAGEVDLHQDKFPDNALAIVHSIVLSRDAGGPKGSGGVLVVYQPWAIAKGDLNPISYRYTTSLTEGV